MCLAITEFFMIFYAFCDNVMFDFVVKWRQGGATVQDKIQSSSINKFNGGFNVNKTNKIAQIYSF